MSDSPAGWYPDPYSAQDGDLRYWDGAQWLSQTQSAAMQASIDASAQQRTRAAWEPTSGTGAGSTFRSGLASGAQQQQHAGGALLASWGARLLAYLIDGVIMGVVAIFISSLTGVLASMNEVVTEMSGDPTIDPQQVALAWSEQHWLAILVTGALSLGVQAVYSIFLTATRGQTVGKMLVGIKVLRADSDAPPSVGGAAMRWLVQFGPNVLAQLSTVSFFSSLFMLLDGLFPLWDARRQSIHDKVARTQVVRTR